MGRSMKTFSDEIRAAIEASGLTRYRICKEIGLGEAAMSRFMAGKGGLSMEVLDKIAPLIGMHVTTEKLTQRTANNGKRNR